MLRLEEVIATEAEIAKGKEVVLDLVSDSPNPFSGARARELAQSVGECEAYREAGEMLKSLQVDESSGEIQDFLFKMRVARNALLHASKK